ncbi:metallophosphoesterase [Larsenimonas rhizosphaerae]|uniref:Metallophosphoesterase n=1 Tax=Larsenimonas rhizosphaerae TaxID=2944682 RepID=A0AA42CXQ1_9GAMM|nr:metallophosphoesterase [Larsenimonas rhizosphaerae]MCX2524120.1 metallophosphoesterase [Larsenimonas rhizosphaerae]
MTRIIKRTVVTLAFALLATLVWGVVIEPYTLDQRNTSATVPNLPRAWEGRRIALLADFQSGMWLDNTSLIDTITETLLRQRPAAVIIAGDFVYHPTNTSDAAAAKRALNTANEQKTLMSLDTTLARLKPLMEAGIPVHAVLGNHDYAMASPHDARLGFIADAVKKRIQQAGITVLQNRAVPLSLPDSNTTDQPLYLVGIGSHYAGNDHVEQALETLPADAARLVVMHNPASFPDFPAHTAPLAMAGHTHGGQMRLPGLPQWSWMSLFQSGPAHTDGWIEEDYGAPGNRLYVNRGIGFSMVPIRIDAPPELTMFTLQGNGTAQ